MLPSVMLAFSEDRANKTTTTVSPISHQDCGLLQPSLLGPKTYKWCLIHHLSLLNKFLKVQTFKIETQETIRLSLQTGEWVTCLDFSDTYFHIHINQNSQKYLGLHWQNHTFWFTALPCGLSIAPMEFTIVVKEVKLMAQARHIQIHQYLDN